MRLTIGRWVATILGCWTLVAVLLVPLPATPKTTWFGVYPPEMSSSVEALAAAAADLNDAVREYRVAQGVARWKAQGASDAVQIDRSVPASIAALMRTVAENEWHRAGDSASASSASVFIYFDTSAIAGASSPNNRRALEVRRPADVWYALPEITDGERCVVLVRVRTTTVADLTPLGERSLLGPCAFFAAFGKPGAAVRQWLDATRYRAAYFPDWDRPRVPSADPAAFYTLDPEASRCLTDRPGGCAAALGRNAPAGSPTRFVAGNSPGEGSRRSALRLGDGAPRFLADAVRELGHSRFAQFWTSAAPLDSAFASAAHGSLDEWAARWLERSYGKPQRLPAVRLQELLGVAVVMPVLMLVAAGRRERVLSERFRLV